MGPTDGLQNILLQPKRVGSLSIENIKSIEKTKNNSKL